LEAAFEEQNIGEAHVIAFDFDSTAPGTLIANVN
jgi:hypothetical protein